MPTLILETDVKLERVDLMRRIVLPRTVTPDGFIVPPKRTPGLHLSGLLKYIAQQVKITTYLEQIAEEDLPLRWAIGMAWEEFAASLYPNMIWQPGEVREPVVMTCDGITTGVDQDGIEEEGGPFLIEEFKFNRARRYKGADLIQKKWLWMQQGLGYCLGYGTEYVRWHVLSALEWPDPVYTKYLVQFSREELDGCARMIEVNKEGAIREGYSE
jgi:hypothetical protein